MRPPSRWLAPGAGTAMPPPPRTSGGGARGREGPPHSPPPPLHSGPRADGGRPKKGQPRTPPEEAAAPGVWGHHGQAGARTPCPLPADGGPAAPRTAQAERPYQRPARERWGHEPGRGGSPPLPPPPPGALTRRWPTGPRPTPAAARQPPWHEYTPEGHAGDNRRQADARRGSGARGRPPHPPHPPLPPPSLGATGAALRPPGAEGTRPPPRRDRDAGGGMRLDLHTARPSAPSRLLPRGSRPQGEPGPACWSNARTKLGGGARRRTRTVWRPRPT